MRRQRGIWKTGIVFLTLVIAVLWTAFPCYAANYKISAAAWDYDEEKGIANAWWEPESEEKEDRTSYRIRLYRGTKVVSSWKSVSKPVVDYSEVIINTGTGEYYFQVSPRKDSTIVVNSDSMKVDSYFLKALKTRQKEIKEKQQEDFENGIGENGEKLPAGWVRMADGTWRLRLESGKLAKACFLDVNGRTYYFDSSGIMLTGWQVIGSNWYCFDESGALLRNTVTPDGYRVNENGVWVEDGQPVSEEQKKVKGVDAGNVTLLTDFTVNLQEKEEVAGQVKKVSIGNTKGAQVIDTVFSVPQENWTAGQKVGITVTYRTYAGYGFSDRVKFNCSKAAVKNNSGNSLERTVVLDYVPNLTLVQPEGFYISSDDTLHWDRVPNADQYEVRVVSGGSTLKSQKTAKNSFPLEDYLQESDLQVKVTALRKGSDCYKKSKVLTLDVAESLETLRVPGTFAESGGRLRFKDENGEYVKDRWINLQGYWYHFNRAGYAEPEGWFREEDGRGHWYYFDAKHRMMTGTVNVGGKQYQLNDGSRGDLPVGACLNP